MDFKIIFVFVLLMGLIGFVEALPSGPDAINITSNETSTGSTSGSIVNISGGYVANLNVTATVQNPHWKGFVGWIDGMFTLDDASGSSVYDWSLSSVSGEIYASRNASSVNWTGIGCASAAEIDVEDGLLDHTKEDNISSTFSGLNSETYVIAGVQIAAGDCFAANSYINNVSQSGNFEEIVLHDSSNVLFAAEIENAVVGYDGVGYDFQMIVPENGNETFTGVSAYYLYVEID
mgnify:CR=1 FL=1|jgi:hypothetical protein